MDILLRRLSHDNSWTEIETDLNRHSIRVYQLGVNQVRIDATTNSGYHLVTEDGLFQFGHSKDNPNLPQIKTMMASLDPLGMPLVTEVVSGEKADDGLYVPALKQIFSTIDNPGLLCVGDCKMSAINTRAEIHRSNHYYLTPLSRIGQVPQFLAEWIELAWSGQLQNVKIVRSSDDGQEQLLGTGYELEREQETTINGLTQTWTERVFLIRSSSYLKKQKRGLETRLETARKKLHLLSLAVRILTLTEFVVRRSLQESGESLLGLYSGNPKWIVFNILSILF